MNSFKNVIINNMYSVASKFTKKIGFNSLYSLNALNGLKSSFNIAKPNVSITNLSNNTNNRFYKNTKYFCSNSIDDIMNNDNQRNYQYNKNQSQNQNNPTTNYNQNQSSGNRKRTKIMIIRDGMNLVLNLVCIIKLIYRPHKNEIMRLVIQN